jgi:uncharacterized lipoprotein YmbA
MRRLLVIAALALAACAPTDESPQATPETTAAPTTAAPTTRARPTSTTLSERQRHWQEVVKTMGCEELAELEQKRLAVQFNDQAESLAAIHDRQAKLDCPQ